MGKRGTETGKAVSYGCSLICLLLLVINHRALKLYNERKARTGERALNQFTLVETVTGKSAETQYLITPLLGRQKTDEYSEDKRKCEPEVETQL